ncbi:SusC/RagA family TonB-linked outer membrane protein [Bacteroidales bacterium]|nr:SusC/RagA family TonB-linked outer membrane protein [Bacteroidales bacterium]
MSLKNATLKEFFNEIENKTNIRFSYLDLILDNKKNVTIASQEENIEIVLETILTPRSLTFSQTGNTIAIKPTSPKRAEKIGPINGLILDSKGEPIIGASVVVKGTNNGTITDIDGRFELNAPAEGKLIISYIGYNKQELSLVGKSFVEIILEEDIQALEEVVVVGYGTQKKVNMSGSVSSLSSDELTKSSSSNLSNSLVGRLPGLIAVNNSGKPGEGSKLLIRGMGTWNNSEPLVIVDGIERDFSHLDPNEVETVSVLKDAASAAVYGARAANGVILVTTKRGKLGKPIVSVDSYRGVNSPTRYPALANSYEWALTRNKAYELDGISSSDSRMISPQQIELFRNGAGTNWYDETFNKTASQYYVNANLAGGSENIKYFASVGHHNEDGMIDNFNYKKYNFRTNVDAKVTKRFSIGTDIDASIRNYNSPGWDVLDLFNLVPRQGPNHESYHPNGLAVNTNGEHLIEMVHNSGNKKETYNNMRLSFKADYKIPGVEGLTAKGTYSYGKNYTYTKNFFIPYSMYDLNDKGEIINTKVVGEKTKLNEKFDQGYGYLYNISLNYSRSFSKHDIGALFLYEEETTRDNNFSAYRTNFSSNSVPQLFAGGDTDKNNDGSAKEWARNGIVGRLNYTYDQRYIMEASFRYDGSITFPKGSRYGFFPSVSGAWRMSNESFIKDNFSAVDNLKLRASYGTLGNDRVNLWQYMSEFTYKDAGAATIGGLNANSINVYKDLYPNPNITWEKSTTINLGLEGMLWKNLLSFEIDYYTKRTKDILARRIRTIPQTFGASLPDENYGILDNHGIELVLNHSNKIGSDFSYRIGLNYSFARNKVIRFDENENTPDYYKVVGRQFTHVSSEGYPLAGHVGMVGQGMFQSQEEVNAWAKQFNGGQKSGDIRYADVDKNGVVNEYDLAIVDKYGSIPEIIYGFNLNMGWKGIELSGLFQGAAHKSIMLGGYGTTMFSDGTSNFFDYLADGSWTPDNRDAKYPRPFVGGNSNNNRNSTVWMKSGDYLRLKNVELSYTFPRKILERLSGISSLRIYANGTNLLTFDSLDIMDPESSSGSAQYYPQQKSINFGFNLSF